MTECCAVFKGRKQIKGQTISIHCFRRTSVSSLNYPFPFPPFQSKSHPLLQPQLAINFFRGTRIPSMPTLFVSTALTNYTVTAYSTINLLILEHQFPLGQRLSYPVYSRLQDLEVERFYHAYGKCAKREEKTMQVDLPMFQRWVHEKCRRQNISAEMS